MQSVWSYAGRQGGLPGRKDIPIKTVLRLISPNKHVFEMFDGSKGEDAKTMEITYTRQ